MNNKVQDQIIDEINGFYGDRFKVINFINITRNNSKDPRRNFVVIKDSLTDDDFNIQFTALMYIINNNLSLNPDDIKITKLVKDKQDIFNEKRQDNTYKLLTFISANKKVLVYHQGKCGKTIYYLGYYNSMNSRRGCPICLMNKKKKKHSYSVEQANQFMLRYKLTNKFKLLEYCGNIRDKSLIKCLNCGNVWKASLDSIRTDKHCPKCTTRNKEVK